MSIFIHIHSIVSIFVTLYFYIEACFYTKAKSYKDLTTKLMGTKMGVMLEISLLIAYYGVMTGYIIISAGSIVNFVQTYFNM